ncbi:hypothetical protein L5515_004956 [Caenorhabditis briggsae]|uniref:C2H2-type domain-containing protein n=1 Tax=Caenorhabditis briggsae TaxID=6238 RepID=A0AAE9ENZ9_CAEBR|nr:hypothetical protein L5515_004956 [Caenorhabditis briggsae]
MSSESNTNVNLGAECELNKKRYPCPFCESSYIHQAGLRSHVLNKHQITIPPEEAKKNLCEVCSRSLSNKGNLNEHKEVIHGIPKAGIVAAGRKEFPCDQCEKKYFSKFGLRRHVEQVHSCSSAEQRTSQATITVTPLPKNSHKEKQCLEKKTETDELDEFVGNVSVYMESLSKVTIPHLSSFVCPSIISTKHQTKKQGFRISDILKAD